MKDIKNVFVLLGLILVLAVKPAALYGSQDQGLGRDSRNMVELVRNGGCEAPLVNGEIPEWEEVIGTTWTQRSTNPSPYEGQYYFFAGANNHAELRQDVELDAYADLIDTGNHLFEFSAYVQSWPQSPADASQIILEYLNHDKTQILGSHDFGEHSTTTHWVPLLHEIIAPLRTRFIRIRLISIKYNATNNDGYFDAVSLRTGIAMPLAAEGLSIFVTGADLTLQWAPVIQDTAGNPITVSEYRIYADDQPDFVCEANSLVGTTNQPQIEFPGLAGSADRKFFKVVSVVD
ncbi:MAG: hypothetical protein RBR69_02580 [Candidatus Cloacimonadaceae bacterium]|jgi:hypothetical protein|nr:hypothetical protein [Candidatus Cloacimonadota bacterium]MDD3532713.1 hypothetical protein [Candidatus Cloacimonadota bacterium]MDY0127002.1 hypothetical protein [Candidatus Cloacimonadaceae bacterium]